MARRPETSHRLNAASGPSLRNWQQPPEPAREQMESGALVHMGWGRLIFAHTFHHLDDLIETLTNESPGDRDVGFYLRDPHVALSKAPGRLFLDPSHTYRIWLHKYRQSTDQPRNFTVRRLRTLEEAEAVNRIYAARGMVTLDPEFMLDKNAQRLRTYLIAVAEENDAVLGAVTGVDHVEAFNDPENGASMWSLAVDPQSHLPGVGEWLVRHVVEHYATRGRAYVDLSVMHDNQQAIGLYEKLGFQRVPVFCIKHKNPINEPLFTAPQPEEALNPYARIIVHEARRRGLHVEVIDAEHGYFRLTMGGRSITCRESLTELTHAVAMSRCDDKSVTRRVLLEAGLNPPPQQTAGEPETDHAFLEKHGRLVVKPARGEQGRGITVDVRTWEGLQEAIELATPHASEVLLEPFEEGEDLRVIVIDFEYIAAAVRRPPSVTGTGEHTVADLIEKYDRRRAAATGGESHVPRDARTRRCVVEAGYQMEDVLPAGESLRVRKTANLHTGGTIHDVTEEVHPAIREAATAAARALDIPVVGLDFLVPHLDQPDHVLIEANERPGLANHEPQPTAERFIDFLFPQSIPGKVGQT